MAAGCPAQGLGFWLKGVCHPVQGDSAREAKTQPRDFLFIAGSSSRRLVWCEMSMGCPNAMQSWAVAVLAFMEFDLWSVSHEKPPLFRIRLLRASSSTSWMPISWTTPSQRLIALPKCGSALQACVFRIFPCRKLSVCLLSSCGVLGPLLPLCKQTCRRLHN